MPAATTKAELSAGADKEFAKLEKVLRSIPEALHLSPDPDADGTTLKDIVGHRAAWIDMFLGWVAQGQSGEDAQIPAPGYKWNDLKRFNADLRASQSDLTWDEVCDMLRTNHARLIAFIAQQDDAALYGGPMPGGGNKWTTGRWTEAAGPSHYRSAAKYIRARLRAGASNR